MSDLFKECLGLTATVTSGPPGSIDQYELKFARRALRRIKERLGLEEMEKLLQPDIQESDEFWRETIAQNTTGEYKPARVQVSFQGISANEFLGWFHNTCSKDISCLLGAQPEHYLVVVDEQGRQRVIENLGEHVSRFNIKHEPPTRPWLVKDLDEDFPIRMSGYGQIESGEIHGYVLHQFRNTTEGFDANLAIYYPATTPDDLFEQHRQHLLVEFRNWVSFAYQHVKSGVLT
ncbi:hypothetical protein BDV18DRAFT_164650 [Aspergillus unguis]